MAEAYRIQGETGANDYIADYVTPGAAQIEISGADSFGRACGGKRAGGQFRRLWRRGGLGQRAPSRVSAWSMSQAGPRL